MNTLRLWINDNIDWLAPLALAIGIILTAATCGVAQPPSLNRLGGGCQPATNGLLISLPKAGQPWTVNHRFPEPPGAHTVSAIGFRNPKLPLLCGTLHTSADILLFVGPAGTATLHLPPGSQGLEFYLQAAWSAWGYKPALSDAWFLRVGV